MKKWVERAIALGIIVFVLAIMYFAFVAFFPHKIVQNLEQELALPYLMKITSSAFVEGERIPNKYTCIGENINPTLIVQSVPAAAESLVLIMDDPDAPKGTFVHWIVYNIPTTTKTIEEGKEPQGAQGYNSANKRGYLGPCPPSGTHRYFFKLYALNATLQLSDAFANKERVEEAMQGKIIDKAELMGTYSKE
jgi:hypothetical protein